MTAADLMIDALAQQLCETEHHYISTRFLLSAALTEIRRLNRDLKITKRYLAKDRDQIRQLMGIRYAHHQ